MASYGRIRISFRAAPEFRESCALRLLINGGNEVGAYEEPRRNVPSNGPGLILDKGMSKRRPSNRIEFVKRTTLGAVLDPDFGLKLTLIAGSDNEKSSFSAIRRPQEVVDYGLVWVTHGCYGGLILWHFAKGGGFPWQSAQASEVRRPLMLQG